MKFIEYCSQPDNASCINNMMYDMKLDSGFDYERILEWAQEQAEEEGVYLNPGETADEIEPLLAEWYNELDTPDCGAV
jgi:hypothetical protein